MSDFCEGPAKPIAPAPAGEKGGPGVYDGANSHGLQPRTGSGGSSGVPEKFYDTIPGGKPSQD